MEQPYKVVVTEAKDEVDAKGSDEVLQQASAIEFRFQLSWYLHRNSCMIPNWQSREHIRAESTGEMLYSVGLLVKIPNQHS